MADKTKGQQLREDLFYKKKTAFELKNSEQLAEVMEYAKEYMHFLDVAKTEREAVIYAIEKLEAAGFKAYKLGDKLEAGDKIYYNNRGKSLFAIRVGTEDIEENGIRIIAAHVDSPRLDLKQHPLYESEHFGYLKTHYYGGVRKYQWVTIPLALHGVVTKKNGETVEIRIGDQPGDPVLCITDLLPHLAKDQNGRPLGSAFEGEGMNAIIASSPYLEEDGTITPADEKIKLNVLAALNEKYGIIEADFMSAELTIVPAGNAQDVGLDRWLIGAYGHDDRVCAYTELTALIDNKDTEHTVMMVLADKEETGSNGVSGMQAHIFMDLIDELACELGANPSVIRANSKCLSADVTACYDPLYAGVSEKRNTALIHCGVGMAKYTGGGGKGGTSDASAEFVGEIRNLLDENGVIWQTSELGKVDQGGGGTVAMYIANMNIDTVDLGVPVLSMHAPFEIISKHDLYEAYRAFAVFCK